MSHASARHPQSSSHLDMGYACCRMLRKKGHTCWPRRSMRWMWSCMNVSGAAVAGGTHPHKTAHTRPIPSCVHHLHFMSLSDAMHLVPSHSGPSRGGGMSSHGETQKKRGGNARSGAGRRGMEDSMGEDLAFQRMPEDRQTYRPVQVSS